MNAEEYYTNWTKLKIDSDIHACGITRAMNFTYVYMQIAIDI